MNNRDGWILGLGAGIGVIIGHINDHRSFIVVALLAGFTCGLLIGAIDGINSWRKNRKRA